MLGLTLIGIYVVARFHGFIWNYAAVEALTLETENDAGGESSVDFSLWDSKRIQAYKEALIKKFDPPLAVLQIDRIHLQVAVFEGTDDLTLNRGVGLIVNTSGIGGEGNIGIAGHRDGFFRGLKDVVQGDTIQIIAPDVKYIYSVDRILVVKPEDVSVLDPGPAPSLTLVTCYPFYFVGHAPERYIIKATLKSTELNESMKTK